MFAEKSMAHAKDGIPQNDPDRYWNYRFNLMLDAASAIHGLLDLLVDYRQKRKLTQFLLCCCDVLEVIYDRRTEALLEYRFRIDLSDRIAMLYSSRIGECYMYLDGKRESLPTLTPDSQAHLSSLLDDIWEDMRNLPDWKTAAESQTAVCVIRSASPAAS